MREAEIFISSEQIFILLLIALGLYYSYLAFNTQFLGEDEASYIKLGEQFSHFQYNVVDRIGLPRVAPPLVSLLFSPFFLISFSHLGIAKAIVCILGFLTLFIVFRIGKRVNMMAGIFSVLILLSIPSFTHHLFIAYMEVPIAFFSALTMYYFLTLDSLKKAIVTGIILGLANYVKFDGIFFTISLFLYMLILFILEKDKQYIKYGFIACVISFLVLSPWIIWSLLRFNYIYVIGVEYLGLDPPSLISSSTHPYFKTVTGEMFVPVDYFATFGEITILAASFGLIYVFLTKERTIFLCLLMFFLFMVIFLAHGKGESRYLSIIFPQIALIGGIFLGKFYENLGNRWAAYILLIIVSGICLNASLSIAKSTSTSQRFPDEYIDALTWLKENTPEDSLIFTTYCGSTNYFAKRECFWAQIPEYPLMMESNDSTFIYDSLKKYNTTHILIWRALVGEKYFYPERNLVGIFSNNFVDSVQKDSEHFKIVYSNPNNLILELK